MKKGKARVFYNLSSEFKAVSVVGLGDGSLGYNKLEEIDEGKETVRTAAAGTVWLQNKINYCILLSVTSCIFNILLISLQN